MTTVKPKLVNELTEQEATSINGGFLYFNFPYTSKAAGAALGASGSGWWRRNFYSAARRGNYRQALNVTDRYINGLTNTLRRFGVYV